MFTHISISFLSASLKNNKNTLLFFTPPPSFFSSVVLCFLLLFCVVALEGVWSRGSGTANPV